MASPQLIILLGMRQGCPRSIFLFSKNGILARTRKEASKEVELSLFADDMLFHIENPKDTTKKKGEGVLTDGQVVRNLPGNAGDTGSIPNERTKIPHAQLLMPTCSGACVPQVESQCTRTRALQDTVKILLTTTRPDTAKYLL